MKKSRMGLLLGSQNNWKLMTQLVSFYLIMALFFLPLSPTIKSFFIVLAVIGVFITPAYWKDFSYAFSRPWAKASSVIFLIVVVACFWGTQRYQIQVVFIEKYSKLLMIPLFAIAFRNPNARQKGIVGFIVAMCITCVLSIYKDINNPGTESGYDAGKVFHNHIETGYLMAFAVYLLGLKLFQSQGMKRAACLLMMILLSYQVLFISSGRTAHVAYYALILMLLVRHFPIKKLMVAVLAFTMLFAVVGYQSRPMSHGFLQIINDIHQYQHGNNKTSVGYRITFHKIAKELFMEHPWIGSGTGGFSHELDRRNTMPEWKHLLDPHSQYWLIASDFGLLGILAVLIWYVCLFKAAIRLHEMKPVLLGLLVSFMIANITDSLLFYSVAGYLFVLMSALALGESIEEQSCQRL